MCNDNPFIHYLTALQVRLLQIIIITSSFINYPSSINSFKSTTLKEAFMNYLMNRLNLRRFNFNGVLNYLTPQPLMMTMNNFCFSFPNDPSDQDQGFFSGRKSSFTVVTQHLQLTVDDSPVADLSTPRQRWLNNVCELLVGQCVACRVAVTRDAAAAPRLPPSVYRAPRRHLSLTPSPPVLTVIANKPFVNQRLGIFIY